MDLLMIDHYCDKPRVAVPCEGYEQKKGHVYAVFERAGPPHFGFNFLGTSSTVARVQKRFGRKKVYISEGRPNDSSPVGEYFCAECSEKLN